jgi:hypothetical protein
MIFYTSKSTFIFSSFNFPMSQCAVRQFENELVERQSTLADRHLRPPAPSGGTVSRAMPLLMVSVYAEVPIPGAPGTKLVFWVPAVLQARTRRRWPRARLQL